jgi:hypothetical protein
VKVVVVVRSTRAERSLVLEPQPGWEQWKGLLFDFLGDLEDSVKAACLRTAGDAVCRSFSVEVHAEGADCDHEVPSA